MMRRIQQLFAAALSVGVLTACDRPTLPANDLGKCLDTAKGQNLGAKIDNLGTCAEIEARKISATLPWH